MSKRNHEYTITIAAGAIERIKALSLPADPPGCQLWYSYIERADYCLCDAKQAGRNCTRYEGSPVQEDAA